MRRILAFDGGPRALMMCYLLQRLEQQRPGVLDKADLFAGTSAGAAVAALIAAGETATAGLDAATALFRSWNPFRDTSPVDVRLVGAFTGLNAFMTHRPLRDALYAALGDMRIGDVRRRIVVPTVEIDNQAAFSNHRHWTIQVYHNLAADLGGGTEKLVDVILRSSSIPVLQPVYQGHVDGGLYANNPSLNAMCMARDFLGAKIPALSVLSLGQGVANTYMQIDGGDVGYRSWLLDPSQAGRLIRIVMDANEQATNYYCSRLLEDRFVRLDPHLSFDIEQSPGLSVEDFDSQVRLLADKVSLAETLGQLDAVGWFD